jgi:hypothetical protein
MRRVKNDAAAVIDAVECKSVNLDGKRIGSNGWVRWAVGGRLRSSWALVEQLAGARQHRGSDAFAVRRTLKNP